MRNRIATAAALMLFFLLVLKVAVGQSVERTLVATYGSTFEDNALIISQSLGEITIGTSVNTSFRVSQGFHQGSLGSTGIEEHELGFHVSAYPNPTTEILHLKIESIEPLLLSIELFDLQGRTMLNRLDKVVINRDKIQEIDFRTYPPGSYLLNFIDQYGKRGNLTVIKQ
jgi:hypothetical protein